MIAVSWNRRMLQAAVWIGLAGWPVVGLGWQNPSGQQLCEQSGGTWDPLACGHYYCGFPQECAAVIPGCDCGPGGSFEDGLGCVADQACAALHPVQVIVDMDSAEPGMQSEVTVPACTAVVHDVAVYVIDPLGGRAVWAIGYLGGLERGIAFGHMPGDNQGAVVGMYGSPHTVLHPANSGWLDHAPYFEPGFVGPEVQYVEWGAEEPAMLPDAAVAPIFTVDISLDRAMPGDRFAFYLLDRVTVWTGGANGCFSTQGPYSLDSGGDVTVDQTSTIFGVDPDPGIAVPPASYAVDYVDGAFSGGGAAIVVVPRGADLNGGGLVDATDLAMLLGAWGAGAASMADLHGDGVVDAGDLAILLDQWGGCGP